MVSVPLILFFPTERRIKFDVILIHNILNGLMCLCVYASYLLSKILLAVPHYYSKNLQFL